MTDEPVQYGESLELEYKGHLIRALMVNGVPWFSLADILDACRYNQYGAEPVHAAGFPSFGKMVAAEEPDPDAPDEPSDTIILSPVGVFYWASKLDPWRLTGLTAWVRQEAKRLCPSPAAGDPAMFLTLTPDADGWTPLPPGPPPKYSGWKAEWEDLKWSDPAAWYAAEAQNGEVNRKTRELNRRDREERRASGDFQPITIHEIVGDYRPRRPGHRTA